MKGGRRLKSPYGDDVGHCAQCGRAWPMTVCDNCRRGRGPKPWATIWLVRWNGVPLHHCEFRQPRLGQVRP
jgi:hypothetical protein